MVFELTTLRNDFEKDGFAIAPNLFTRNEVEDGCVERTVFHTTSLNNYKEN